MPQVAHPLQSLVDKTLKQGFFAIALVATLLCAPNVFGQATQIEAEDYTANLGIDTETTTDAGGGLNLCHTNNGDWAEYSIDIPQAGSYEVDFRVASAGEGGSIDIVSGGSTIGSVAVAVTGGWQDYTNVSTIVTFANAGLQTIRLNFNGDPGFLYNINWFSFQVPPILIEAESFTANDDVQTETTTDTGGGLNIGYIVNGDWSEYSVTIPEAGDYSIDFRTASNNNDGGELEIVSDGVTVGNITVPDTNGWQNWTTITTEVTFATAGTKTLRLNFTGGAGSLFNINWFIIRPYVPVQPLAVTVGTTLQQKMRYGMDYERLWYWSGSLNGSERNEVARWSAVDADIDFVRVAMNSGYELTEGTYDLSAYTNKIIPLMQEMQEANPNIKYFASPRPLDEAVSGASWQPYPLWVTGASSYTSGDYDFGDIKCAEYIVKYLLLMKSYGFKISFLDVTNEWQSNVGGGRITQDDMDDIHNYLHVTYMAAPWAHPALSPTLLLEPEDIPELVGPSSWNYSQGTSWINNLDSGDVEALSIASSHNTDRSGSAEAFAEAVRDKMGADTEIWNTELHGWKSTSSENETTSFYYYLEAIRAGFGGINGWLAIGTTNQGHAYILNPNGTPTRNVKYYIYRKLASTSNYGHALDILDEPEEGVFNAPLDSNDDDVPRNVAAFIKGNLMTVWVVNENSASVPLEITPSGRTIAESTVRLTRWTDPSNVEGFVSFEQVDSGASFISAIPAASVCCYEIVLDGEDFSNDLIQTEDFTHQWGTGLEDQGSYTNLSNVSDGDFTRYGAIALEEDSRMSFSVARPSGRPDGFIEIREGSADGPILGQVAIPVTGNWQTYQTIETTLDVDAGIYNLYLRYAEDTTTTGAAFFNMDWFTVNEPSTLLAPTGIAATAIGSSQINLSWNTVSEATSYKVLRATSAGGTYTEIASGLTTTATSDTSALPGVTYYYVIRAVNAAGESPNSSIDSATLSLDAPTGLSATPVETSHINLSWNASSGATSYEILRATSNTGSGGEILSIVTTTSTNDTTALPGITYYYAIRALSSATESSYSPIVDAALPLNAPTGLAATNTSSAQIDLNWTTVSGATGYTIKRSLTSGGTYTTIATAVTSLSYSDTTSLTPGTRYYYVVTATLSGSESNPSNEDSAVPSDPIVPEDVVIASMSLGYDLQGGEQVSASIAESGLGQFYQIMASPDLTDASGWTPASAVSVGNGGLLEIEFNFDYSLHDKHFFRLGVWTEE